MPRFDDTASRPLPRPAAVAVGLAALAVLWASTGCSPRKARLRADRDAYALIDEKAVVAGSDVGRHRIGVDPCSRMHDPHDPDCPPMPPDDPVSHAYLECVDGKKGAKYWRKAPRTTQVENVNYRSCLPLDDRGRLVLDTHGAMRIALLNNPDYQAELEELYLSALDVSFERFRFDAQLLGGSAIDFTADGRVRSGRGDTNGDGVPESSSAFRVAPSNPANRWRFEKLGATGGEYVVGIANSIVWQFAGPNDYSGTTLLDFSIVQPLLRGGGRVRVLERLTVAERTLLANIRAMERYRREFYAGVVVGRFPSGGPERRGGILGGAGLANFAGVGLRLGGQGEGGFFGNGFAGNAGAAAAGGYLGLMQSQQVLQNQRANVAALRDSTLQLEASYDAGRIDRFQVDLARQALFNAQSQLLRAEADLESALDNFKLNAGLPPDIVLVVDDPLLERFNLLDPPLTALQNETAQVLERARSAATAAAEDKRSVEAADQAGPPRLAQPLVEAPEAAVANQTLPAPPREVEPIGAGPESPASPEALLADARRLIDDARQRLTVVEEDMVHLTDVAPRRRKHLARIGARDEVIAARIDPALFSSERFDARVRGLDEDLVEWKGAFERASTRVAELEASPPDAAAPELARLLSGLSSQLLELSILQARARLDAIDLEPTDLSPEQAFEIARRYRRDWANARAALVDSWRLIHFNANDLQSAVDLVFSGDLGNVGDNPLRLRDTNGRLRVGLEFDTPTSRLAERNVYRQSLIEYQQARRNYYRFVDRVHQQVRSTLRQTRLNEINLELRREAVFVAIAQVDLTQLRLSEPPKPGATAQFNNTTARDLVQALGDLLSVQNDLLSVWVNNRVQRITLELDLDVMELDREGLRVELDTPWELFLVDDPCNPRGDDVRPVGPALAAPRIEAPAASPGAAEPATRVPAAAALETAAKGESEAPSAAAGLGGATPGVNNRRNATSRG
ncbi:MAG: TolC family protein [Lacipirellulaceae bacterium]